MITIKQIKELANGYKKVKGYKYIGIRVQDQSAEIGDTITHLSNNWIDGKMTDAKLNGVCAVKVQKYQINLRDQFSGYEGDTVIILGSQTAKNGYDEGEIVMHSPVVLAIL